MYVHVGHTLYSLPFFVPDASGFPGAGAAVVYIGIATESMHAIHQQMLFVLLLHHNHSWRQIGLFHIAVLLFI